MFRRTGEGEMHSRCPHLTTGALLIAALITSCEREPSEDSQVRVSTAALTSAETMGFEVQSAWSTTTPGVTLSLSSTHSQGSFSLSIKPSNSNGHTPLASVPLTSLHGVTSIIAWDVMLPTQQPIPSWQGTAQTYLNCPSRNIFNAFLSQVELTGKPLNVWNTLSFPLTSGQVLSLMQAGYSDLTITVVLTVAVPTSAVWRVDNLRFLPTADCIGKPNGGPCSDGNGCTLSDRCVNGTCQAGPLRVCPPSDQCHNAGVCSPATGACSNPAKPNATACNDNKSCTTNDKCQSGTCTGTPKANGTTCNDGNACTQTDQCQAQVCVGLNPKACSPTDQCHGPGICNSGTGLCTNPSLPNGTRCIDGNGCTLTDTCQAGSCTGTNAKVCVAIDQCHTAGVCHPPTGTCSNPTKANGTICSDGKTCTTGETCQQGLCTTGAPPITCMIEAESFATQNGMTVLSTSVRPVQAGSWMEFANVDFGAPGDVGRFQVLLIGAKNDQHVEFRLDSATGPLVADLHTLATDQQGPTPQSAAFLIPVSGVHRVAIVAVSINVGDFDWFSLEKGVGQDTLSVFPPGFQHQNPGQGLSDLTTLPVDESGLEEDDLPSLAWTRFNGPVQIAPGKGRIIGFSFTESLVVFGRAEWSGSGNIAISILDANANVIASGGASSVPGGGRAEVFSLPLTPRTVGVAIRNLGVSTLSVKIIAGGIRPSP